VPYSVVSNPEFLKEGAAVEDFMRPDRIVVGADDERARYLMQALYAPFQRQRDKLILMDVRSAELTKYAANAMLATRISFMNEMALLAEKLGADIEQVRRGIGSDPRIGTQFLYAGCGYGGSCFPKDVKALLHSAANVGEPLHVLAAVERANERQKHVLVDRIVARFGDDLRGRHFALWGLAFKPDTDDLREAPSRVIVAELARARRPHHRARPGGDGGGAQGVRRAAGARVRAHADAGAGGCRRAGHRHRVEGLPLTGLRAHGHAARERVVFDGRNLFDPELVRDTAAATAATGATGGWAWPSACR
jgi:UDPglucose 6-dehydrogenase